MQDEQQPQNEDFLTGHKVMLRSTVVDMNKPATGPVMCVVARVSPTDTEQEYYICGWFDLSYVYHTGKFYTPMLIGLSDVK